MSKNRRPRLNHFIDHYNNMYEFDRKIQEPDIFPKYIQEVSKVTSLLVQLTNANDFELGLKAIKICQGFDLENLAQTAQEKKNVQTDILNINMGETHFLCLRDYPDIYKNHLAPGFIPRDRKENGLNPQRRHAKSLIQPSEACRVA